MSEALLIVDLQNDFMPGGALAVEGADKVVPIINHLIEKFTLVIVSRDSHPKGHVSFEKTWPVHCVEGTEGAELVKELKTERIEKYFHKGSDQNIDSYSAFFDNGVKSTGLHEFLSENGVTKLYLAGLTTDFCVLYTVLDGLKLGYEVVVVKDACKGIFDEEGALKKMHAAGAQTITSLDLS